MITLKSEESRIFSFFSLCGSFFFSSYDLKKKFLPNRIQSLATRHRTRWTKFFFLFLVHAFDVRKPQSPSGLQIRRRVSFRAKPVQKWTVKNPSSCVACVFFFLPSSHNTQPMISSHKLACPCLLCAVCMLCFEFGKLPVRITILKHSPLKIQFTEKENIVFIMAASMTWLCTV